MHQHSAGTHSTDRHARLTFSTSKLKIKTLFFSVAMLVSMLWLGVSPNLLAQDAPPTVEYQEIKTKYLPYHNPMQAWSLFSTDVAAGDTTELIPMELQLDSFERDMMLRIANIYSTHVQALKAQVNNEPVEAERLINASLTASQDMLDEYPEIRSNTRFAQLSRAVVGEYRAFYGITEEEDQVQGEIFAIQEDFLEDENTLAEDFSFPKDTELFKTSVPLLQNAQVNRHLVYYTLRRPDVMEKWRERAEVYKPMMLEIFREEGMPEELVYLAFIESGLNPTARSWASAVGMWQFIAATARVYGIEINWWVDERRDPEKATRAAARHLKDLYNVWGDWHLAMANYNISPRGLNRAINRAGGVKDYWAAYPYLPRETRGYVPGFIATTMINLSPEEFGFQTNYGKDPYSYETVEVDGLMSLEILAEAMGVSTETLKGYNPELLRWATPPGTKYALKVPVGKADDLLAIYDSLPRENQNQSITMHTVQSGESIGLIARKYGTTVSGIYASNDNLSNVIYPGQLIAVPLPAGSVDQLSVNRPTNQRSGTVTTRSSSSNSSIPANSVKLLYKVKTGDTIGHIAEWHDVRAWQIRSWNGIGNTIRVGQNLTLYVSNNKEEHYKAINSLSFNEKQDLERRQKAGENIFGEEDASTYVVKRNDTLIAIARSFGISTSQLRELNDIAGSIIYVGQVLKVR
jgi:membrane-bound lytic murein transglycosylase D